MTEQTQRTESKLQNVVITTPHVIINVTRESMEMAELCPITGAQYAFPIRGHLRDVKKLTGLVLAHATESIIKYIKKAIKVLDEKDRSYSLKIEYNYGN